MHPFGNHVVGQHQIANDGDVIVKAARSRIGRQPAKMLNDSQLAIAH